MLGGIIGPITEELAVTATEKSSSYPSLTIAGISAPPMAEVSATAEPDTPAKNMEATILALARLPGTQPMTTRHSSRMSSMIPTRDISSPARINIGTAINVKLLIPWKIC